MFNKENLKGFILGVCSTVLIAGSVTAFAMNIDVEMGGIKVFWDGVEKTLLDAKGQTVEPLIYNGTTYVPVRAMSNLMGKTVDWDQKNMSVFVGGKPAGETTPLDKLPKEKINRDSITMRTGTNAKFTLKDKTISCSNLLMNYDRSNIYVLDNQYSELVGKAVMPYTSIGSSDEGTLIFYSVADDGTKSEIEAYELKQTEAPVDVKVSLKGVTNLEIFFDSDSSISLYDVNLIGK